MKLNQKEFAARFGFSLDSIQNWEQGRRIPDGPARTLLAVIAHEPKAVERALRAAS
jgi:putative transcriptional regulator